MTIRRNRLNAGEALEPRVMLSGSVPGAEAPAASDAPAPEAKGPEDAAAPEDGAPERVATEAEKAPQSGVIVNEGVDGVVVTVPEDGSIDVTGDGIEVNAEATINNNCQVSGDVNGVNFVDGLGSGTLNNGPTGVISSDSRAVNIGGEVELNNDGKIIGTGDQRNGTVFASASANNFAVNNNGLIDAGKGNLGAGFSAELTAEGTEFDLNNPGTIQGRGDAPAGSELAGDGIRLERTRVDGSLANPSTGLFTGEINNDGLIDSEGANGTVAGFRAVDGVGFQGALNNNGTISGVQNGVYFGDGDHRGGVVNNAGTISSDSRAFNLDGKGLTVNNAGQILATDTQRNGTFYADATAQDFTLNNDGLIDAGKGLEGAAFSVELDEAGNDFTINNAGTIQGRGDAAAGLTTAGDGIRLERTRVDGSLANPSTGLFTGEINNDGLIASEGANGTVGGFRAVDGVDFQGDLNNNGTITGVQNGVYFGNGDHTGGTFNNAGKVTSDSRAVNIDGDGLTVNNFGHIEATGRQRNGTVYADATADNFTITNSGSIDARPGAGSGISVEVGSEKGDVQNGTITNTGQIFGSGELAEDAGVRLATSVEGGTTFRGDIFNSGSITADQAAVLVEDGVYFDGDFINSGSVDGAIELSSGDVVLTSESIVTLDITDAYNVEQIDTTDNVTFGGTLQVNFADGFVPEAGQTFDLIDFGSANGSFTSVQSDQVEFDLSNLAVDGTITVLGSQGEAEEPAAPVSPREARRVARREARVARRVERQAQRQERRESRRAVRRSKQRSSRQRARSSSSIRRRDIRSAFASILKRAFKRY